MNREKAIKLLHANMKNQNLRRHCYAVEAVMRSLAIRLNVDIKGEEKNKLVESWGIAGLIHDADYELTKDFAKEEHTKHILKWLKELDAEADIYDAVASHAWQFVEDAPSPKTKMQWALYCCDELTGFIVAVALVRPDKKLSSITVDSILKKWNSLSFAAGVDRKQIEQCEFRLDIPLKDFIQIALTAMQGISKDLGL